MKKRLPRHVYLMNAARKFVITSALLLSAQIIFANAWYVNDASLVGDVFTTAIGSNANAGSTSAPFATMQFAIDAATSGDTIYVDAGIYNDGDVTVSKSLVLRGAKFGVNAGPAAVPIGRGTNETIITGGSGIYYGQSIDNITVDGFTINLGTGIRGIEARGLNSVIINNIVIGVVNILVQQAGISTRANGPLRLHSYLVSHNNVIGCRNGFFIDGNLESASEFSYNYAAGCVVAGFQFVASNGHLIKANVSENNLQGMQINKGNNVITQNTLRNNARSGIRLVGTSNLSGNVINYNYFIGNDTALNLTNPAAGAVNNEAHYNSFTSNNMNIVSTHAASLNATCNWLESINPPDIALTINGNIIYDPFLSDGVDSDPGLDGFQPITSCIIVPVILTSFNAAVKNYDVILSWQTATEINSSHFIIERSADNQDFYPVGRVEASGYSDIKRNYQFTDNKPAYFDRPTFYRLAMVDRDGSMKYSRILNVMLKTSGSYVQSVYPVPAKSGELLNGNFISGFAQTLSITLANAAGQIVLNKKAMVIKGLNKLTITLPATSKGVHFLIIRSEDGLVQKVPVTIY
ncbi:MAG TPA: hypothetical protein PLC48_04370 [Ferruginibacter sp.]|nr:hypothetical protein [Ferruginibacter sp.]